MSKEKAFPIQAVRLASSVFNLTSLCNERNWNAKGTDTMMTSPEREAPKTSTERSAALRSPAGITLSGIYSNKRKGGGRFTRLLPHAKMLLVSTSVFLCWVDYALEGSTFSLSRNVILAAFFTLRGHRTHIDRGHPTRIWLKTTY